MFTNSDVLSIFFYVFFTVAAAALVLGVTTLVMVVRESRRETGQPASVVPAPEPAATVEPARQAA